MKTYSNPRTTATIENRTPDDWALTDLEYAIHWLLIDFANKHGCVIDQVRVDTRNFANLAVEVFLKEMTAADQEDDRKEGP